MKNDTRALMRVKQESQQNSFANSSSMGHSCLIMSILSTDSSVMEKTRGLCQAIVNDEGFKAMHADVEAFLTNDEAREAYKGVHEKGAELQDKQRIGVELTAQEMTDFEIAREQLMQNPVVVSFMQAQQELQMLQKQVNDQLGLTIELGRLPTEEEIFEAGSGGGCCGGGCGSDGGGCS